MPRKGKEPAGLRRWRLAHRKKGKSHRSGRSSAGASKSDSIGRAYLDGKVTAQIAAPVIDLATHLNGQTMKGAIDDLKFHALSKEYAAGAASAIAQRWGDKKIGQAAALSRGSATAWLAEAVPYLQTAADGVKDARSIHSHMQAHTTGYSPLSQAFGLQYVAPYAAAKYGLGIARKIANKSGLLDPVKKGLSMVGATL